MYDEFKSSGITENTPKNLLLGAGTIHRDFQFTAGNGDTAGTWNFEESLIGATSGGMAVNIVPTILDIDIDGALVKTKGLTKKIGERAYIDVNMVELTPEWIKTAIIGKDGTSTVTGYDVIESKRDIEEGDYVENFAYVGRLTDGTPVIIIFDYALCTTGLTTQTQNKDKSVFKATFECYAETTPESDTLPYHIYMPTPTV